jgi:DNA-directed RNA polymerase subunit RPC12/RpoP
VAVSLEKDVVCVHCRKSFRAEVLSPDTAQAGFKCPHCKLFMPLERLEPETYADASRRP